MGRRLGWVLVAVMGMVGSGLVWAKKPVANRWEAVESLAPGTEIDVSSGSAAGPDLCLLSTVDDSTLTCLRETPGSDTRLVFPRSAVRDVWVFEKAPERHIGLWIAVIVSAGLEITACVGSGVVGGLLTGFLISAVWLAAENPIPGPIWWPPPPPRQERYRRRLVYEAPLVAVAP